MMEDYLIEDIRLFKYYFTINKNTNNINRKYKLLFSIKTRGSFQRKEYILKEPTVYGFDFKKKDGKSS